MLGSPTISRQPPAPKFGALLEATLVVADLAGAAAAWTDCLRWSTAGPAPVSAAEAARWQAPAAEGAAGVRLVPAAGGPGAIRLLEDPRAVAPMPFRRLGWVAVELVVADIERTVERLAGSAFELFIPPAPVGGHAAALRAAQFVAPGGIGVYLTEIRHDPPGFTLPRASAEVGRVYIAVLASQDLLSDRAALEKRLGARRVTDHPLPVRAINRAFGFDPTRRHRLSTLQLPGQSALELDAYPAEAVAQECAPGHLPPGIALVTVAGAPGAGPEVLRLPGGALVDIVDPGD